MQAPAAYTQPQDRQVIVEHKQALAGTAYAYLLFLVYASIHLLGWFIKPC